MYRPYRRPRYIKALQPRYIKSKAAKQLFQGTLRNPRLPRLNTLTEAETEGGSDWNSNWIFSDSSGFNFEQSCVAKEFSHVTQKEQCCGQLGLEIHRGDSIGRHMPEKSLSHFPQKGKIFS